MITPTYFLLPLQFGSVGPVEDEEREEGRAEETRAAEEEGAEFGVLAFAAVRGVVEPDGGVDADAQAAEAVGVGEEAGGDGEVGEGALFACWAEDLEGESLVS